MAVKKRRESEGREEADWMIWKRKRKMNRCERREEGNGRREHTRTCY